MPRVCAQPLPNSGNALPRAWTLRTRKGGGLARLGNRMLREVLLLAVGFGLVATGRGRYSRRRRHGRAGLSDDLRDRFLGTISHELRTPLNTILGWTQMLKAGALKPAEVSRAIDVIDRNARVEARLVDDLLDLSRMIRGRVFLSLVPVDLVRAVERVVASLLPAADAQGVVLRSEHPSTPVHVLGNEIRLQQLIRHLVGNSVKFTPRGGRINVRVEREGKGVLLRVQDEGVGIPAEHLSRVLEPFYQVPSKAIRRGLGLGLALAAELVELHGGLIGIASKGIGTGTVVSVRLPTFRLT
jgi:signal transduction histidine kinase